MAACKFSMIVRSLSSTAVQQQMIKPPVQIFGLHGRYACALYSAGSKLKQLEPIETELVKFQALLKTDVVLREFIANPTIKRSLKVAALKQVSEKFPLSPPSANLLGLLAENGRLKSLEGVITAFKTIMAAHRGEVACVVTTAKPVDEAMRKEIETALKGFVKKQEKVLLTTKVDPTILGGMIVSIGDKYVDMSVSSKIKKLTDVISAIV